MKKLEEVADYLPPRLRAFFRRQNFFQPVSELRLRADCPLNVRLGSVDLLYDGIENEAYFCTAEEIEQFMRAALQNSYYAAEHMLKSGYFTLKGGHRVGIGGRAAVEDGRITGFSAVRSINIRIAHAHALADVDFVRYLCDEGQKLYSTLVVGPPLSGKTTFLRSLAHFASSGLHGVRPMQLGLVDEKSEIAGLCGTRPAFDIGWRTDILDRCPKCEGMLQLIRNMAPELLVTDEIGGPKDAEALCEAVRCGVRVLASAHANDLSELCLRPLCRQILLDGGFRRVVELKGWPAAGQVQAVYELPGKRRLQ